MTCLGLLKTKLMKVAFADGCDFWFMLGGSVVMFCSGEDSQYLRARRQLETTRSGAELVRPMLVRALNFSRSNELMIQDHTMRRLSQLRLQSSSWQCESCFFFLLFNMSR
jgi:hypothetical protein